MKREMLNIIGVAYGNGADDPGCEEGPIVLSHSSMLTDIELPYTWLATHTSESTSRKLDAMPVIRELNQKVAKEIFQISQQGQHFVMIGGDQSCSLGTWSGAATAVNNDLGLIWIDAHMDAHTAETTPSGNIHGMPLAALMGFGDPSLTGILTEKNKLKPENVVLIGIRSHEPEEAKLLDRLGLRIFYMPEINEKGIEQVMTQAKEIVTKNTESYGVSIDLDGIDPLDAPGVGTPEPNGINGNDLCQAFAKIAGDDRFIGAEIVEFNPHKDQSQKTEKLIINLINAIFSSGESS